ncbi:MAG: hypothetical protein EBR09_09730 [Proteobacteria bacterium]|nr:hypothetical protein [Pseudomonadota bacterium]
MSKLSATKGGQAGGPNPPLSDGKHSTADERQKCIPSKEESKFRFAVATQPQPVWDYGENKDTNREVIPDSVIRAFKTEKGVCVLVPHHELGMICGNDLETLPKIAETRYKSPLNPSWPAYDYRNWLSAPYISGSTLFALAHSEWYQCLQFDSDPERKCATGSNHFNSWSNAVSSFRSTDSGLSWSRISTLQRPESLSVTFPNLWSKGLLNHGFFHPSNIIFDNGHYYAFVTHVDRNMIDGSVVNSGSVLLRTNNLTAKSWEQVGSDGKTIVDSHNGNVLNGTNSWDHLTVTFNTAICKFLVTFWDYSTQKIQYSTLKSLNKPVFERVQTLANQDRVVIKGNDKSAGFIVQNYPTGQLDAGSDGNNFEFTDDSYFMYFSSFTNQDVYARKIYRVRIDLVGNDSVPTL